MSNNDLETEIARSVERAGIWQVMRALPWPMKLAATIVAIAVLYWKHH
jgi:hypothetical protein